MAKNVSIREECNFRTTSISFGERMASGMIWPGLTRGREFMRRLFQDTP